MNEAIKKTESIVGRKPTVDLERCMNWCLLAYTETRMRGYFLAYKFDIPSTEQLLPPATQCGLVLEQPAKEGTRPYKVWHDILKIPTEKDARKLLRAYQDYTQEQKKRAEEKAAKEKAAKAKALADKYPSKPQEKSKVGGIGIVSNKGAIFHKGTATRDYLIRVEAKLNYLIEMWDGSGADSKK